MFDEETILNELNECLREVSLQQLTDWLDGRWLVIGWLVLTMHDNVFEENVEVT